jgi:hypothetical protein
MTTNHMKCARNSCVQFLYQHLVQCNAIAILLALLAANVIDLVECVSVNQMLSAKIAINVPQVHGALDQMVVKLVIVILLLPKITFVMSTQDCVHVTKILKAKSVTRVRKVFGTSLNAYLVLVMETLTAVIS